MSDSESEKKSAQLEPELRDMKIEEGSPAGGVEGEEDTRSTQVKQEDRRGRTPAPIALLSKPKSRSTTHSPVKQPSPSATPGVKNEQEEVVGGDITLEMEPGKAPKLNRAASRKIVAKPPTLYSNLPDATEEAKSTFVVLSESTYGNKHLGTTEHALECDCAEEWDPVAKENHACGDDSDCINRATKMECMGDCGCGAACQNQRFLRRQYADVTVFQTEKKGYGLRANADMQPGTFIFEYIGEVINEVHFRRRMIQYDEEGIKHFYFMSLTKGEFVDATKKGNLGRFCNHSCNPNCFVDKWVVGDKLRMGIFAERKIAAGEELVFNYNVDRYGANPQPCYCGEPNCTGFIGGRSQTDNATKLSHATIEALGIEGTDGWDTATTKRPRRKKAEEGDEEYINDLQPTSLQEDGVTKVMAALMQCKEKWIAVKLLDRIQRSDDEKVSNRIIRMHGYTILKNALNTWMDDFNVVIQILDILDGLPRITRNKIQDSKIEETVENLKGCGDERVEKRAINLLDEWSKLEVAFRIPRVKRDPNGGTPIRTENHYDRREKRRERSKTRSPSPSVEAPKGPALASAPSAPRALMPARNTSFHGNTRAPPRPRMPQFRPLPAGWFEARDEKNGRTYFYNSTGETTWVRPSRPAQQPPPPPPKAKADAQKLQDIIASITKDASLQGHGSASTTPQPSVDEHKQGKKSRAEKLQEMPQEKKEKLYEVNLFPHVKSVTDQYRKKLDKEDLKKLAKEVAKKLVRGDFKSGRVQDPQAKLPSKHVHSIKKFVKEFMDKAVEKKAKREKEKAARTEKKAHLQADGKAPVQSTTPDTPKEVKAEEDDDDDEAMAMSDDEDAQSISASPTASMKRKREEHGNPLSPKKSRLDMPPAPTPPPPPPVEDIPTDIDDSGLTPMEDISDPFHNDGVESSTSGNDKSALPSELAAGRGNYPSPQQLATPPTTTNGSEHDSNGKVESAESKADIDVNGASTRNDSS